MIYDFLKNIATNNNWVFVYSRSDYQNLYNDMTVNDIHLFVDPITIDSSFSDSGHETKTYSGQFMLLVSSDIDEEYIDKYNDKIKPIITDTTKIIKDNILCAGYEINKFQTLEVINRFDFNLDGVIITYNITIID